MIDLSKVSVYKKKRKSKKKYQKTRTQLYAEKLNKNLPASEQWFQTKWNQDVVQDNYTLYKDQYNVPLGKLIPDVINQGYKYIIEIDGSIHDLKQIKFKDAKKDFYYNQRGYKVFRVKAYDESSYQEVLSNILLLRSNATRQY